MKHKKPMPNPFTHGTAVRLTIFISIILNSILTVGYSNSKSMLCENLDIVSWVLISNAVLLYLLFILNFYILKTRGENRKWILIGFVLSVIFTLLFCKIVTELAFIVFPKLLTAGVMFFRTTLMTELIAALIVLLMSYLLTSAYENQQTLIKNEQLISENIRARYEVLKSQVDPHFLFNSLNTLDGLISMDACKAHEYVHDLSAVFRYTIGNKEVIQLKDELEYTQAYINLMKIRYGDSLNVKIDIDDSYSLWYIMPVSLQLLVENAIKHNVISNKYPFVLTIESNSAANTIKVWNKIQSKTLPESGEGIGLANLEERYRLLFQKSVIISSTDIFSVELPLIQQLPEKLLKV